MGERNTAAIMNERPFVSVIVPVWNGARDIARCIDAIARQDYPADRFELLVVDNGSTDDTREVVRAHRRAILLKEPTPGSYAARNLALRHVRGSLVIFTDADCVPARDWISAGVAAMAQAPDAGVIGGRIDLFDENGDASPTCAAYEQLFSFDQKRSVSENRCVTANWLSPAAVFRDLGGFDATLKSGADGTMALRVAAAGHRIVYADGMVVGHPVRGQFSDVHAKFLRTLGGRWTLRRPGPARIVIAQAGLARSTVQRARRVLAARQVPLRRRMAMVAMLLRLQVAGAGELARLALGGETRRS